VECASHVVERSMRGQRTHAHRNAHAALGFHGYSSAPSRGTGGGRRLGGYYRQRIFSRLHTVVDQGRRERRLKTNDTGSSHASCPSQVASGSPSGVAIWRREVLAVHLKPERLESSRTASSLQRQGHSMGRNVRVSSRSLRRLLAREAVVDEGEHLLGRELLP